METAFKKRLFVILVPALLAGMAGAAFAEDAPSDTSGPEPQKVNHKLQELKKLKQENPQEFERLVQERKQKMKEKLKELKEKDPKKFQQVTEKIRGNRRQYLKKLREENPEKFHQIMQKKMQKLEDMKQSDPEKYQRFIDNHPRLARRASPGAGEGAAQGESGPQEGKRANGASAAHAGRNDS